MPSKTGKYGIYGNFSVDVSELINFQDKLENNNFILFLEKFLNNLGDTYIKKVVEKTPEDTGLLKKSWIKHKPIIDVANKEARITIQNTQPYASFVEWGHRGVFVPKLGVTLHTDTHFTYGRFMMTDTNHKIKKYIKLSFGKAFKNWFNETFDWGHSK